MPANDWTTIEPQVNSEAEFFEILNDFGNPLEILREAISNAVDAHAKSLDVSFTVSDVDGTKRLVITMLDDGRGMTGSVLKRDFWGLGFSPSRDRSDAIGEKGHGTKIYLRSEKVTVRTQSDDEGAYIAECDRPLSRLSRRELHQPRVKPIEQFREQPGTEITIVGYNDNERSKFTQDVVRDYLLWFTKLGSIEMCFGPSTHESFQVRLKALDRDEFETIPFGHPFPDENADIDQLFKQKEAHAADWYVKRYTWKEKRLTKHPEVTFQAIVSVEGDGIKRQHNQMIRKTSRADTGRYRVADRYGIWLCKDFIPIARVNDWIPGFGSGSNAFVLLHGFINCQALKLTANRGTIANTDPQILEELKSSVQDLVSEIDTQLRDQGIYTLRVWQEEEVTLKQERADYANRLKQLKNRRVARLDGRLLVEPRCESEVFGLFMTIYTLKPDLFEFEPLDYNTTRGIDIVARNKGPNTITEGDHWYVELKYLLGPRFNHAFQHLRWILCWDFDKSIAVGSTFQGVEETDLRKLVISKENDRTIYFLDSKSRAAKIQVIRLSEYLREHLDLEFKLE